MTSWLNPKLHKSDSDNYRQFMTSTEKEIMLIGSTRTSKTTLALRKQFGLHFRHEGFKSATVRAASVDLHDTIREDIKFLCRYPLDDPRCPIKAEGGTQFHTLHINGGRMVIGGMNRPRRILGTGLNYVLYSQADQSTNEEIQTIKTRLGALPNWKDANGNVLSQFVLDSNPTRKDHHLMQRMEDGTLPFIQFSFMDNPLFYRKKRWSRVGKNYVEQLDKDLEGVYHDWYFKGIAANPEGAVFTIGEEHILDALPDDIDDYLWYNAMDFGMTEPNVCLWIGQHHQSGDVLVAKEFRHTGHDVIEFGNHVRDVRRNSDWRVLRTIIDNDENRQSLLLKNCGISSEMARKGPGSIQDGINIIQQLLRNTTEGRPKALRFYKGLREDFRPDAKLVRNHKPLETLTEMRNLQYRTEEQKTGSPQDDLPVGRDKHGIDALRYWCLWRFERAAGASFASGGATRRKRL